MGTLGYHWTSNRVLKSHWLLVVIEAETLHLWNIISLVDIKQWQLLFLNRINTMTLWQPVTGTGSVEIKLVAKQKWSTIESKYLRSGSSGTPRNRVTGYSMYSFQPYFHRGIESRCASRAWYSDNKCIDCTVRATVPYADYMWSVADITLRTSCMHSTPPPPPKKKIESTTRAGMLASCTLVCTMVSSFLSTLWNGCRLLVMVII